MKRVYLYLFVSLLGIFVSCNKDNSQEPKIIEPEVKIVETSDDPLTSLSVSALNKLVGVPYETLIERLKKDKVEYKDEGHEIVYYTTKEGSPFQKYKIQIAMASNLFDFDKKPYELYRGVDDITIRPVDEKGENIVEGDYKKVFDYFYPLFTEIQPNKKPLSMTIENTDVSPKIKKEEDNYQNFIKDLSNVDGVIVWNNNPPTTEIEGLFGGKTYTLLSKDSSKEKNTPIITMNYWYKRQGWLMKLKFNRPSDYDKNLKK